MDFGGHDHRFWITVAAALGIKLVTSPFQSRWRAVVMVLSGLFIAWVFTMPVVTWLAIDPETYVIPVAALLAITGEGIVRWLIHVTPDKVFEMIWRGSKK